MLIVRPGTKVKIKPKCNFYFSYTLDDTNWDRQIQGPYCVQVEADENTFLTVLETKLVEDRLMYKVSMGEKIGWVTDGLLISSLYGHDFYWKVWHPYILEGKKYNSEEGQ